MKRMPVLGQVLAVVSRQHLAGGWAELEWGVRTGGLMFERHYGEPFFRHLTAVEGLEATYSRGMANLDHTCEWRCALLASRRSGHTPQQSPAGVAQCAPRSTLPVVSPRVPDGVFLTARTLGVLPDRVTLPGQALPAL